MKLGLVTFQLAQAWDIDTIIDMCQKTGFEGVELRTTHAHGVEPDISAEERATVRAKFADSGVTLWGYGTICEYAWPDAADLRRDIELTKEYVKLAQDTGAVGVKVRPNHMPEGVEPEQTIQQIGESLRECGEFAEDYNVPLWLEVHGRGTSNCGLIRQIMDIADHPLVQVCWNSNYDDKDENGSIESNFRLLQDKIGSCHIYDLWEDYPWHDLFRLLDEIDYQGFCLTEMSESCEPERLMKYYRLLFDAWRP
jgi:sugar phosphate isomerase/epimerase